MFSSHIIQAPLQFIGRFTLLLGLLAIGVGVGYGLSIARAHGGDGVIHVCVNNSTGAMRHVSNPVHCRSTETLLEWNEEGPQGPQGDTGATGPQGPQGDPGISGYEVVTATVSIPDNTISGAIATCPTGKNVLGGGLNFSALAAANSTIRSSPWLDDDAWSVLYHNGSGTTGTLTVSAICATVSS